MTHPPTAPSPAGGVTPPDPDRPPTVGELFATLSAQMSSLVQGEIELAKVKAATFAKRAGAGAGLLAAAAFLALYLLWWVFHTIEVAIAVALPGWAASLIVVGIMLVTIAALAALGIRLVKKGQESTPTPQEGIRKDIDAVKKGLGK